MKASARSGRFIQYVSLAKATNQPLEEFIEHLARDHGDVFDFVIENFDVCMVWWINAKKDCEIL